VDLVLFSFKHVSLILRSAPVEPIEPPLSDLLPTLVRNSDPHQVAYAHNYLLEERITRARHRAYEGQLGLQAIELRAWRDRHRAYLFRTIRLSPDQVPETFTALNQGALLADLAMEQWVVRLESLDRALAFVGATLSTVDEQLNAWRQQDNADRTSRARLFLEHLCERWNRDVRRDSRPSFVAFYDEVREEAESVDWPNRLRDRLGMSHYHVPAGGQPIPVALLRYRIGAIVAHVGDRHSSFAVPTVLDGELNTHFFPAPREIVFGRTLDLAPDDRCERLLAEIVHRRIDYTPDHIYKVGWVSAPVPPYERGEGFVRLRNGHLECLRRESGRNSFGEEIPEAGRG